MYDVEKFPEFPSTKNTNVAFISIWKVAWCNIKAAISIEINFASLWKDSFLKILIVSYTIRVAITFSSLPHCAVLPRTTQPPSANHRSDLVAFCRLPEPQSSIRLLVSAILSISLSTLFPKQLFQSADHGDYRGGRFGGGLCSAPTLVVTWCYRPTWIWIVIGIQNTIWRQWTFIESVRQWFF